MATPVSDVRRDPRYKKALRAKAARMYEGGSTVDDVAKALNVSKGRAYILILEGGAKLRSRGPK